MDGAAIARETVRIFEAGQYQTPMGKQVILADDIKRAVKATVLYSVSNLPPIPQQTPALETRIVPSLL